MATTASKSTITFILWAPDHTDARRLSVRSPHLENMKRLIMDGTVSNGGPVLASTDSVNAAPSDRKFYGSFMIFEAESLEAARKLVESDIYYKSGVWDKDKIQILPTLLAVPLPGPPLQVQEM